MMDATTTDSITLSIDAVCGEAAPQAKRNAPSASQAALIERVKGGDATAWDEFDKVLVMFSGGKDSLACVLALLDMGCPKEKLELWHHLIDGSEGEASFMDWPVTSSYCRAVAAEMGLPLRFSWKEGGFRREMLRDGTPTAPTSFEKDDGSKATIGGKGPAGRRMRFPQVAADLKVRWCSAYLKVDVGAAAIRNDERFDEARILVVTGERREESAGRARYPEVEVHRSSSSKRAALQWRTIIDWTEAQVWERIECSGIAPHPCYKAGFSRCSCAFCIFGNADQFRTAAELLPAQFERVAEIEDKLDGTLLRPKKATKSRPAVVTTLRDHAASGTSLVPADLPVEVREACASTDYTLPVVDAEWKLPAGAFREGQGGAV